ncbi:15461_t:CDS:2 [Funneliformis geosporum]|nr:15461_t:CDS:2 [Funneliformis geosporum]
MILHGDGSANIFVKDGLLPFSYYEKESEAETKTNFLKKSNQDRTYFNKETNNKFDIVVSNPPFSVSLANEAKEHLKDKFIFGDKRNSENLFIERWYQLLKPNGRLGVVLPESVFDTTENKHIRLFIYKYFEVKAVISLPQLTFKPFTPTKTSLLFARKKTKQEIEDESEERMILLRILKDCIEENDEKLSSEEIVKKYQKELVELSNYDNDTKDYFGLNEINFKDMLLEKNYLTTNFENIGKQKFLRLDFGYRNFFDIQEEKVFSAKNYIRLREILELIVSKKVAKGELEEPEILVDIGNIERRLNNLINVEEVKEIGSDKNVLQAGDIVIPKLQPRMGNFFLNLEHKRYIASTELLEYKIANENNPYFIYYLFTTKTFLSSLSQLESGKTHRRVNSEDLLKIKVPKVPKSIQDQEFNFDLEKFEKDKGRKFFEIDFLSISKNNLIRLSPHFHTENKLEDKV